MSFGVVWFYQKKNRDHLLEIRDFQREEERETEQGSTNTILDPDTSSFRENRRKRGRPDINILKNVQIPTTRPVVRQAEAESKLS